MLLVDIPLLVGGPGPPLWKIWKIVNWDDNRNPNIHGKMPNSWQPVTTNQIMVWSIPQLIAWNPASSQPPMTKICRWVVTAAAAQRSRLRRGNSCGKNIGGRRGLSERFLCWWLLMAKMDNSFSAGWSPQSSSFESKFRWFWMFVKGKLVPLIHPKFKGLSAPNWSAKTNAINSTIYELGGVLNFLKDRSQKLGFKR